MPKCDALSLAVRIRHLPLYQVQCKYTYKATNECEHTISLEETVYLISYQA